MNLDSGIALLSTTCAGTFFEALSHDETSPSERYMELAGRSLSVLPHFVLSGSPLSMVTKVSLLALNTIPTLFYEVDDWGKRRVEWIEKVGSVASALTHLFNLVTAVNAIHQGVFTAGWIATGATVPIALLAGSVVLLGIRRQAQLI